LDGLVGFEYDGKTGGIVGTGKIWQNPRAKLSYMVLDVIFWSSYDTVIGPNPSGKEMQANLLPIWDSPVLTNPIIHFLTCPLKEQKHIILVNEAQIAKWKNGDNC